MEYLLWFGNCCFLLLLLSVASCLALSEKKQGKPNWKYKCSDKTGHNHPVRKTFSFIIQPVRKTFSFIIQGEPCKYCVYTLSSFLFSLSEIMILFFTSMSGNLHDKPIIMKKNFFCLRHALCSKRLFFTPNIVIL